MCIVHSSFSPTYGATCTEGDYRIHLHKCGSGTAIFDAEGQSQVPCKISKHKISNRKISNDKISNRTKSKDKISIRKISKGQTIECKILESGLQINAWKLTCTVSIYWLSWGSSIALYYIIIYIALINLPSPTPISFKPCALHHVFEILIRRRARKVNAHENFLACYFSNLNSTLVNACMAWIRRRRPRL